VSTPDLDQSIRALLLLMPRLVGRAKRMQVPENLRSFSLAPRHLSLLAYLLFEGPLGVNELAARLEVAPATVSLMVGDLSRKGILERREDDEDRRRTIVSIAEAHHAAISGWLGRGAGAWRKALEPLTPAQRKMFIETLIAYEQAVGD
jgi:DNA-binding MarR family transcriptional regulator